METAAASQSPGPVFKGHLDHLSPTHAVGWATIDGAPCGIAVFDGAGHLGGTLERSYRPDLVDVGVDPDAGFKIRFSRRLDRGERIWVQHEFGYDLVGSPLTLAEPPRAARPVAPTRDGPIIFLHIPKTAGTSIRKAIDRALPTRLPLHAADLRDAGFLARFAAAPPRLAIGHVDYGVHHMLGIPPRYVTMLREPIERVVSFLRYARALEHPLYAGFCHLPMRTVVERAFTAQTNNHACRMIAGISVDQGDVITERWLLDLAWHNLRRHFDIVGTVNRVGSFQAALGRALGIDLGLPCFENRGGGAAFDDEVIAAIPALHEMNALDIELYGRVRRAAGEGGVMLREASDA